jgi:hypothetical protein
MNLKPNIIQYFGLVSFLLGAALAEASEEVRRMRVAIDATYRLFEAVGAFAEPFQNRMVVPIDSPSDKRFALIRHELTHIFEFDIFYAGLLRRTLRAQPPLWLTEGLASYLGDDEDSFDQMIIRDAVEAMKPGAPIIHEGKERNIAAHASYDVGDVEEAFKKSDHVFEDHFETQRVAHVCPEPHNCIAVWDSSDKLTFYYCSQAPDLTRLQLAKAFGIPESKVRVITHHVGGGFGSRATSKFSMDLLLSCWPGRPASR